MLRLAWAAHRTWSTSLDNLTHGLVGAALAKAGADRATPLATTTLVLAANAPDIDVFSYTQGEYFALAFRRGITHGLPALLVLPFVVTALVLAWDRGVRLRRRPDLEPARAGPLLLLSALGVVTHPALDWMNTYGIRWLVPFDGSWTYGDALFIIDPWIWLVLGGAVFLSSAPDRLGLFTWGLLGLVASLPLLAFPLPFAAKALWGAGLVMLVGLRILRHETILRARPRVARGALGAFAIYLMFMAGSDALARRDVRAAAQAAGLDVVDLMVAPQPGHPLLSEVEVRTPTGFVPGSHHWLRSPRVELDPTDIVPLLEGPPGVTAARLGAIAEVAMQNQDVANYLVWSRYPHVRLEPEGTSWWVRFSDARYDGRAGAGGLSGLRVRVTQEELR
jgi:inner membrane protein